MTAWAIAGAVGGATLALASGTQTQERYADTAEGPAGLIGEIGQTIRSGQARYDLALGVRF